MGREGKNDKTIVTCNKSDNNNYSKELKLAREVGKVLGEYE